LAAFGCTESNTVQTIDGYAQGTTYHIRFWSEARISASDLKLAVTNELHQIDIAMSGYRRTPPSSGSTLTPIPSPTKPEPTSWR
jgi:thiamine biosynthesis lipoprotein